MLLYLKNISISDECKELLLSLLHRNPRRRINWDNFFTHKWFEKDEILESENRLMDINMGTNSLTTASISKYSLRNSTQFLNSKVFKHNSIRKDSSSELYKEQKPPNHTESEDTQFKMSIEDRVPGLYLRKIQILKQNIMSRHYGILTATGVTQNKIMIMI